jgi:hypothetical protein
MKINDEAQAQAQGSVIKSRRQERKRKFSPVNHAKISHQRANLECRVNSTLLIPQTYLIKALMTFDHTIPAQTWTK